MTNFSEWIARTQRFASGLKRLPGKIEVKVNIAPPLSVGARRKLEAALSVPLPPPLRGYLEQGSRDCRFRYSWDPPKDALDQLREILPYQRDLFGGLRGWTPAEILAGRRHFQRMAAEAEAAGEPEYRDFWQQKLPFAFILNGDYLALDLSQQASDPPVVFIAHEDEDDGGVIASNFEEFLRSWEQLCYIGPEIWLLREFRDPNTGLLDPDSTKAHQLRGLLDAA